MSADEKERRSFRSSLNRLANFLDRTSLFAIASSESCRRFASFRRAVASGYSKRFSNTLDATGFSYIFLYCFTYTYASVITFYRFVMPLLFCATSNGISVLRELANVENIVTPE